MDINKGLLNSGSKRRIKFFGNLYHYSVEMSQQKQIKTFYTNGEMLYQQINKFKNVFESEHIDLINLTTELNKDNKNTKKTI